jgi:hypothetical protein
VGCAWHQKKSQQEHARVPTKACARSIGQLRGGVNQLLPCLNNYASLKLFAETLSDDHNNAEK